MDLVRHRQARIDKANEAIRDANRDFDRQVVPLQRKINKIRRELEDAEVPEPVKQAAKPRRRVDTTGLDPEEHDHYLELAARFK